MRPEVGRLVFQVGDRVTRSGMLPALRDLDRTQWLPEGQLHELTWKRLQTLLQFAYENVPYYGQVFRDLDARPADIRSMEDLRKLPVLTKARLREDPESLRPVKNGPAFTVEETSGSSGRPLQHHIDVVARARHLGAKLRGESWYGIQPGDPCVRVWSLPLADHTRRREQFKDSILNRLRLSVFDMSEEGLERFWEDCRRFQPRFIYGYSASVALLARFVGERKLAGELPSLRAVVATAETLHDYQRAAIAEAFGVPVACEYGCTEVGIIAYQCPQGSSHISADNVIVEVLQDGRPVPPGEPGTVVVTGLWNRSSPFVRYELGDFASLQDGKCACGRSLPLLGPVLGRTTDTIAMPEGRYLPSWIFDYIVRMVNERSQGIAEFRVIQMTTERFRIELVPSRTYEPGIQQRLTEEITRRLGSHVRVEYRIQDTLPREQSGKLRYFISEVGKTVEAGV